MAVIFKPEDHSYHSIDPEENIIWHSVTTVVGQFKSPFDAETQSVKSSKNKKSKWYGMDPARIREIWVGEAKRATDLGTFYHNQREEDLLTFETIERDGITVPIIRPVVVEGIKQAPPQKLVNGVYPEHFVYLKSAGICGQSDLVEVVNDVVSITDYKTNKELKHNSYVNWEGISQKMTGPLAHLEDCNVVHYGIQLSIYMYIILKHNPRLKPGKLMLHHITFESDGEDEFGYPITRRDWQGNPIVKEVTQVEVPYYKQEVQMIMNWLINNKHNIKKK